MTRRYRRHPQTAGRIVDGLAFVVTAADQTLRSLNESATLLWQLACRDRGLTVAEAADALIAEFGVRPDGVDGGDDDAGEDVELEPLDRATAEADARECLEEMVAAEILEATEEP